MARGMTPIQDKRLSAWCQKIQDERDPQKFDAYVRELSDLQERRIDSAGLEN
jgi:hypothetical protein